MKKLKNTIKLGQWTFNIIDLEDMYIYTKFIKETEYPATLWSSNFAYLWASSQSRHKKILWCVVDEMLATFAHTDENYLYMMCLPFGTADAEKAVQVTYKCLKLCEGYNASGFPARVRIINDNQRIFLEQSDSFHKLFKLRELASLERHYGIENLLTLSGKEFEYVRRKVNKFKKTYPQAIVRYYVPDDYDRVMQLNDEWIKTSGQKYSSISDNTYFPPIIKHSRQLQHTILVVEIDGKIVGLTSGGVLPNGQSWACFRKPLPGYDGLSFFLVTELAKEVSRINPNAQTMNDGSDMGVNGGLIFFKEKFRPVQSLPRFRIYLK